MSLKKVFSKTIKMKGIAASGTGSLLLTTNTNPLTLAEMRSYAPFNEFIIVNGDVVNVQGELGGNTDAPIPILAGNVQGFLVEQASELNKFGFNDIIIRDLSAATATTDNLIIVTISKVIEG
jgi:hypothetical protein